MINETLILYQPRRPSRTHVNRTRAIGHGVRGVRDVTVERGLGGLRRRIEGQLSVRLEVEPARDDVAFWRPRVVPDPLIRPGSERQGFGQIEVALSLQVIRQKSRQYLPPVICRRSAAEIYAAQLLPVASRPPAVIPRADDEEVFVRRIAPLEQLVNFHRAVEVFLIPPPGDVQSRNSHTVQPWREALPLPERVVVGMIHEVVPRRQPI